MSTEQRENLEAILRQSAFPAGIEVSEQRRLLRELASAQPLPADVIVTAAASGGVPTAEITIDRIEPRHVVLYFHGGVYVLGDAFQAAGLASQIGRRTRAKVISVGYRLAPEHPYPAAVDDALAAYQALLRGGTAPSGIAFAGDQAGSHEVLLDDAIRLARQAATADVEVTLDITPGVPHVFQAYYPILDEAAAALDRAGQLLSAHLTGSQTTGGRSS